METVGEIRVHGNAYLTDDDVIRLAGVAVGKPFDPSAEIDAFESVSRTVAGSRPSRCASGTARSPI